MIINLIVLHLVKFEYLLGPFLKVAISQKILLKWIHDVLKMATKNSLVFDRRGPNNTFSLPKKKIYRVVKTKIFFLSLIVDHGF